MEYFLKDITEHLLKQRNTLINQLSELNENLPNYGLKCNELNNQILNIDHQIRDYVLGIKDIKMQEISNELNINTQKLK